MTKKPSTVNDPSRAILEVISKNDWQFNEIVHGSTVATNALLTRTGAPAALITTKGFRDTLVIGRQSRPNLYSLHPTRHPPLIPEDLRFEVTERVAANGTILIPIDKIEVEKILDLAISKGIKAIAICLLFSFLNPDHEKYIAKAATKRGLHTTTSSDLVPEHREFERMSTTAVNAYVSPPTTKYLSNLEKGLKSTRPIRLRVMQSNGGSISPAHAGREAVRTVLSGPAAGVVGAFTEASDAGHKNLITFDMGGTSADVSLCPGRLLERTDLSIDDMPIRTPAIDVHTIGAGGGSIGWFDSGGALRVGPQSAGADPGPAAYGIGQQPTVTDAHLVLGRIRPDHFLGGTIPLDLTASKRAIETLTHQFGSNVSVVAKAILNVVDANMARALRLISVERGYDPRNFTLVAFGGAGPLHACSLAEQLDIPTVMIPTTPGVLSASGMLRSAVSKDEIQGTILKIPAKNPTNLKKIIKIYDDLIHKAITALKKEGYNEDISVELSADLRYLGQSHEINVPLTQPLTLKKIRQQLTAAHQERFSHADTTRDIELVVARVKARTPGLLNKTKSSAIEKKKGSRSTHEAPVIWDKSRKTIIQPRSSVGKSGISGPAILTQFDSTILVPPNWRGRPDLQGNLIMKKVK